MSHRLFRFIAASALVVALAFTAAACGSDDDTPEPPGPVDATPSGPASMPGPTRDLGTTVPVTVVTGGDSTVLIATAPDGLYLTDPVGMTLYTTLNDAADSGISSCLASCAGLWPPLTVDGTPVAPEGLTGTLGTITRADASCGEPECPEITQVTYNGLPLYLYVNDKVPGDMSARDLGGIWSIVRP